VTVEALVRELAGAWGKNDALRAAAFFAPDGVYAQPGHAPVCGREAILAYFLRFFREGPPWRMAVDHVIVQGERAALVYRFSVQGNDNRWQEREGCAVVRMHDGLIAEWREYDG
jgi:ketosteroid isomerase-like protein